MQPTLTVWNIPEPWARFSFSGWVHYDPAIKPQVGSIVYFRIPDTRVYEVKRVTEIDSQDRLWVIPDNSGVSGEGSDNSELYDWVELSWVIGVVDKIIPSFGVLDEIRLVSSPSQIILDDCGKYATVSSREGLLIYDLSLPWERAEIYRDRRFYQREGAAVRWNQGRCVYPVTKQFHRYAVVSPADFKAYVFDARVTTPDLVRYRQPVDVWVVANLESVHAASSSLPPYVLIDDTKVQFDAISESDYWVRTRAQIVERGNVEFSVGIDLYPRRR